MDLILKRGRSILVRRAPIAQLVELRTFNPQVLGSSPSGGTAQIGYLAILGIVYPSFIHSLWRGQAGPLTVRFRFMLDISVPVLGLRFRDAVPVGPRQQFR